MIRCRVAFFVCSIALLGTLTFAVPARSPNSPLAAKKTLRVMTYNIHVGVGMDKKLDLQRIAEVINADQPDLVGLQESIVGLSAPKAKMKLPNWRS